MFIENLKNCFSNSSLTEDLFNNSEKYNFLEQTLYLRYLLDESDKVGHEKFNKVIDAFKREVAVKHNLKAFTSLNNNLVLGYLTSATVAGKWRKNKISYKLDKALLSEFYKMDIPKSLATDFILKQPAATYYLDISENSDEVLKGLHGIFIDTISFGKFSVVRMLLYSPYGKGSDTSIVHFRLNKENKELLMPTFKTQENPDLNSLKLYTLFLNFIVYLHASNRDIEISERTRLNHSKDNNTIIKDKFREVKEFSVGYHYGSEIKKNKVRYKYVGEKNSSTNSGRKITSHYRAAHWHQYWMGTGDNKVLVPKWIEGVFVKGSRETDDVVIHKVK